MCFTVVICLRVWFSSVIVLRSFSVYLSIFLRRDSILPFSEEFPALPIPLNPVLPLPPLTVDRHLELPPTPTPLLPFPSSPPFLLTLNSSISPFTFPISLPSMYSCFSSYSIFLRYTICVAYNLTVFEVLADCKAWRADCRSEWERGRMRWGFSVLVVGVG